MIFAILISLGGFIISLFTSVLSFLNWNFPPQIFEALQTAGGIVGILWSILPFMSAIVAIMIILVPAHVIRYIFSVLLWLWSLVPWIGTKTELPQMASLDLRSPQKRGRNTIDLRRGKIMSKRTMQDIRP